MAVQNYRNLSPYNGVKVKGELAIDWKVWLFPMMRRTRGAYRPGSRNRAFEPHFGAIACREVTKIIQERPLPPPRLLTQIW